MNLLILGSGGREHALTWKLAQSKKVSRIFIAPGNAGTSVSATNLDVDPGKFNDVKDIVIKHKIDIVVVGPEAPLVDGIHDFFLSDPDIRNIPVIGPDKSAARLEGSKDFAKEFLIRNNIPTAAYRSFNKETKTRRPLMRWSGSPPCVLMFPTRENRWSDTMATTATSVGVNGRRQMRTDWCLPSCSPMNHPRGTARTGQG